MTTRGSTRPARHLCAATARRSPHAPQPHSRCRRERRATTSGARRCAGSLGRRLKQLWHPSDTHGDQSRDTGSRVAARTCSDDGGLDAVRRTVPEGGRMSGGCRVRAGARTQRRVRATAKRLLAAQWPPPPPDRGARAAALAPPLESGARGRPAGSPRSPARVRTRCACVRLLPAHAQPPRRQHKLVPWRFLERGATGLCDGGSEPAPLRVSSRRLERGARLAGGRAHARDELETMALSRGVVSRRSLPRVSSRERARPRETRRTAVLLVPSTECSPRAGRG